MKNYLAKQIYSVSFYPLLFVIFLWIIFLFQTTSDYNFSKFGVLPREIKGLGGIVTSVFIHGDIGHIASNSVPLIVLGMMLFYFYKKIAKSVFIWIWIVSGIWLWIGGRNSAQFPTYHIGASTLIYGLATFLFFSGVFRRHLRLMVVSAMVVFLYGSIMWGIFPFKTEISWEGHLFGALAGVLVAFNYRKEGPQRRVHVWEEEDDEEIVMPADDETLDESQQTPPTSDPFTIHFIYKEKEKDS
jgi:membrane associated rhomboid family serine protease